MAEYEGWLAERARWVSLFLSHTLDRVRQLQRDGADGRAFLQSALERRGASLEAIEDYESSHPEDAERWASRIGERVDAALSGGLDAGSVWRLDLAAIAAARRAGRPVLVWVDDTAAALSTPPLDDPRVAPRLDAEVVAVYVDLAQGGAEAARSLGVESAPAIVLVDRSGQVSARLNATVSTDDLAAAVEALVQRPGR